MATALAAALIASTSSAFAADDPPRVRLETTLGSIVLELDPRRAPVSVENFLAYVDDDFYDGTIFHRVIEGFMIQGGGFDERYARRPTRSPVRNEANNGVSNRRYTISMARTNAPHSATAQFFINTVDNANLDHRGANARGWGYAVFGRVVDGQDVVREISLVPTGAGGPFGRDVPRTPVVIVEASLIASGANGGDAPAAGGDAPAGSESPLPADGDTTSATVQADDDEERVDPL
mgnify:CR=1 FL=1